MVLYEVKITCPLTWSPGAASLANLSSITLKSGITEVRNRLINISDYIQYIKVEHKPTLTAKPLGPGRPIDPDPPRFPTEPAGPGLPSSPAKPWGKQKTC